MKQRRGRLAIGHGVGVGLGLAFVLTASADALADPVLRAGAERVIQASPDEVRALLLDLERFGSWFPSLAEWRVLARGESSARVYGRQTLPWPASDRDYVARYRWWNAEDAFWMEAVGEPGASPAAPRDVVRVEEFRSEWRLLAEPAGGTLVRYRAEGPVDGRLARWWTGIAWQRRAEEVLDALALRLDQGRG